MSFICQSGSNGLSESTFTWFRQMTDYTSRLCQVHPRAAFKAAYTPREKTTSYLLVGGWLKSYSLFDAYAVANS